MTTRDRILLVVLALIVFMLCACVIYVAEWVTGDRAADRAHGRQTGAETTLDLNLEAPTMEAER